MRHVDRGLIAAPVTTVLGSARLRRTSTFVTQKAMRVRVIFGAIVLLAALPVEAGERLTIRVSPAMSFAPAHLVVRAAIEADKDNRSLEVIAESSDFYRSSEVTLEGQHAPHVNVFEFRSLPSGEYEVRAVLKGAGNETRAVTRESVRVIASGDGS
jgi:hypothetical protein